MIRDLTYDEQERIAHRRRLVRLVLGCTALSTVLTVGVTREVKIFEQVSAVPVARAGDLASLRARHDALEGLLEEHHFWTGALAARSEIDDLVVTIHSEEQTYDEREAEKALNLRRTRDEAEAARVRGLAFAERKDYPLALLQFRRAIELVDSLDVKAFGGHPWEHRKQILVDIEALEALEETDQ